MESHQSEDIKEGNNLSRLTERRFQNVPDPTPSFPTPSLSSIGNNSQVAKLPRPQPLKEEMSIHGIEYKSNYDNIQSNPSCLSNFTSYDEGNATPRYFRCTHRCITPKPKFALGFGRQHIGVLVQPFAEKGLYEDNIPLIEMTPIRCGRCGGYMDSCVEVLDNGQSIKCNLCEAVRPIPNNLQSTECKYGMYEFTMATETIMKRKQINGNNILLLVDCSNKAFNSGFVSQILNSIKNIIDCIPDKENTNIGIIMYSYEISFYTMIN